MDSRRQVVGSSSSLTADIFGNTESPPSASAGIFASIFPPPQTVAGRNPGSELIGSRQKQTPVNRDWNNKQGIPAPEGANAIKPNKDGSMYREERGQPCHLSSSLYYGGQDVYSNSPNGHNPGSYHTFQKDGAEDDLNGTNPNGASRGNWWQGSLYY